MKCLILAFDGLEYNFVEDFSLENLKQDEYGKVQVPKECFVEVKSGPAKGMREAFTPLVWFSFLTGKLPTETNFKHFKKLDNEFLTTLGMLSAKITLNRFIRDRIGIVLEALGFSFRTFRKKDYNVPTIFDLTERSHAINVPVYSEEWTLGLAQNPDDFRCFEDYIESVLITESSKFRRLRNQLLHYLERKSEWDLLMVYFPTLDHYGEFCFGDTKKLRKMYMAFDIFVKEAKKKLSESFVLVISDHGIERLGKTPFGKHSDYAFYSINRNIGLSNPKITDFYLLIKNVLEDSFTRASTHFKLTKARILLTKPS
jgi:hypothetical protein